MDWASCHLSTITDDNQIGEPLVPKACFGTSLVSGPLLASRRFAGRGNIDLVLSQGAPLHDCHGLSACPSSVHTAPRSGTVCISVYRVIIPR
jgi:hypothetical protein